MTLSRTLKPSTWNGSTGGVLAVDVTGGLTLSNGALDVAGVGLPAGTLGRVNGEGAGASAAPDRAPAGVGAGSARGGGVALVRAGSIAGTTANVTASGAAASAAGGGGSVVITAASGSFSGLTVTARGGNGSVGGGGGAILLGGVPAVADVSGGTGSTPGAAGRARTDVGLSDLPGPALGVGCRPVLTVATTTATPATWRVVGARGDLHHDDQQPGRSTAAGGSRGGRPAPRWAHPVVLVRAGPGRGCEPARHDRPGGGVRHPGLGHLHHPRRGLGPAGRTPRCSGPPRRSACCPRRPGSPAPARERR